MTNGEVNPGLFRKKPTYLEILNAIERDEDRVDLPDRIAINLWDSFAMGQYREMVAQVQEGQSNHADHQQMQAAMTQAANTTEGVSRSELMGFMQQMNQSNSAAQATLQQQMNENIQATKKATEQHAASIAQEIATQSRKQDQRDAVVDQLRKSLAEAHQTPASVPIPPAPATQEVHTHYHQHQASLQPALPQTTGSDPALLQLLSQGQAASNQRHNATESHLQALGQNLGNAIRHMQSNGSGLNDILQNLAKRSQGEGIAATLAPSDGAPPPPPGAGAVMAGNKKSKRLRAIEAGEAASSSNQPPPPPPGPFFQNFGTSYVAPVIEKKKAKYKLADRPRDDDIKTIAGAKRAAPDEDSNVLRRPKTDKQARPPQPKGPRITERFNIASDDEESRPAKLGKIGLKIAAKLAQHMANNRKKPKGAASSSQDPWEALFGDGEDNSQERVAKLHKSLENKVRKVKKPVSKNLQRSVKKRAIENLR